MAPFFRAGYLLIALSLAGLTGPGCLRYECNGTDVACKPPVGLIWFLLPLPTNGRVAGFQKISSTQGGLVGPLADSDFFGNAVASAGDLNGDGQTDLLAGVRFADDGGDGHGAAYVLFRNAANFVQLEQRISGTQGGFTGALDMGDNFGLSITAIGDLDGDGVTDLAVGAGGDDDGGTGRGAVYILFLNANGTVKANQKISDTQGGLAGALDDVSQFGIAVAAPGDINRDGVLDLVVGVRTDDDGGDNRGAVFVLFLNTDGTVQAEQKISSTQGGLVGPLDDNDAFGNAVTVPGDLNGDGVQDLIVGAPLDDDSGANRGAVYVLYLNSNGTVQSERKINSTQGGLAGPLDNDDEFGDAVASPGDISGDGIPDLIVGAHFDDDGGTDRGAVYVLFLNADQSVRSQQKISATEGSFAGTLDDSDRFGTALTAPGDLNGDRVPDLIVGATGDDDGGTDRGAIWILFLEEAK